MAKKQQIILTHGTAAPSEQAIKDLKLGEVLVQHAADAKDAALHTILEEGKVEALVSFPSTAWVDQKIKDVNTAAGQLESTVSALQTQVDGIDAAYKAADSAITEAYKAADSAITEAYKAADSAITEAYKAADTALDAKITVLDGRVEANEGAIADLEAADTAIRGEFAAADSAITEAYKAADTALKNELNGEIAKKANQADFELLSGRVEANEGAIADLEAADTAIRGEFAAADSAITEAYKAADSALETKLNGEIAKKANQADFELLSGRVADIEGEDAGKSMREVATEEAAKEVAKVVADADADFDTLKEIADWILNDKEGAAALQVDVATLKDIVDGYTGKGSIKTAVDTLSGRVDTNEGAIADLVAADTAIRGEFAAADSAITEAYKAADTALKNELNGEIAKKADKTTVETLSGRVDTNEDAIADLVAADTAIRGEFATADSAITEAYKAADTALKNELNGEIAKKADKTTVEALDSRVTTLVEEIEKNEETTAKALTDLDTRVLKVYEDFAAADSALETKLNGEIAKKANQADFELLSGRVADVEDTYVSTIKYKDATGAYVELPVVNNVVDLSGLVIDGGTY